MADLKNERVQLKALENLFEQKKFSEALTFAEKLTGDFPNSYHINILYVKILNELNRLGDAEQAATALMQVYPDNINLLAELGVICLKLNKYDESVEYYNKILFLDPFNMQAKDSIEKVAVLKKATGGKEDKPVDFVSYQQGQDVDEDTVPELEEDKLSPSNIDINLDMEEPPPDMADLGDIGGSVEPGEPVAPPPPPPPPPPVTEEVPEVPEIPEVPEVTETPVEEIPEGPISSLPDPPDLDDVAEAPDIGLQPPEDAPWPPDEPAESAEPAEPAEPGAMDIDDIPGVEDVAAEVESLDNPEPDPEIDEHTVESPPEAMEIEPPAPSAPPAPAVIPTTADEDEIPGVNDIAAEIETPQITEPEADFEEDTAESMEEPLISSAAAPPGTGEAVKEDEEMGFLTESAAELYLSQGLYQDALVIYNKLYDAQKEERFFLKIKQLNAHILSQQKIQRLSGFLELIKKKGE
ncbi:MAG: hypothetical protein GY950_07970 [bacterium]|nr:hypothetical protein [bacterium]